MTGNPWYPGVLTSGKARDQVGLAKRKVQLYRLAIAIGTLKGALLRQDTTGLLGLNSASWLSLLELCKPFALRCQPFPQLFEQNLLHRPDLVLRAS
jgi:hypothetical protein